MLTSAAREWMRAFRRAALPLGCYYTVALLVPLANGAGRSEAFLDHAVLVASVPLALVTLVAAACACVRAVTSAVPLRRTAPPRMSAARERGARGARSACCPGP